jgi:YidC/Oxa1 family membrane protein insertase
METRRLLIAALLSMAVLLAWQKFFPAPAPVKPPPAVETTAPARASAPPPSASSSPSPAAESAAPEATGSPAEAEGQTAVEPVIEGTSEERVVIESEYARAEWSSRGAQLLSLQLKKHPGSDGGPVDLVRRRHGGAYPFALINRDGSSAALNEVLFAVERQGDGATFTYRGPAGSARKSVTLDAEGLFDVAIEATGDWQLLLGPGLRNPEEGEETRFSRRSAIYARGEDLERIDVAKAKEPVLVEASNLSWVGLQDQYFLTAVMSPQGLLEVAVEPLLFEAGADGVDTFRPRPAELADGEGDLGSELRLLLAPEQQSLAFKAYLGSKQFDRLSALPGGLQRTVDLGAFGLLARPLLVALRWIHDHVVANYGWAIILLTVLLRILLFPLNHKSITSMQKMQVLNPKMQAIRAKYRGKLKDKKGRPNSEASAKMNQEIMALYKQEGVNPAAGCLPMLLQMPVLFAFYRLLSAAVELRHSEWLWISDLSARDPIYVLPIVMGISMFVQQRMTPSQADPMQRRLFMLMPIVFTGLFFGFPAGMVLYWLTNNLLAIAQQVGYKRWQAAKAVAADGGSS